MRIPLIVAIFCLGTLLMADDPGSTTKSSDANNPEAARKSFAIAEGLEVAVWAAEPLLANPVALSFDHAGKAYVAETYRRRSSALDIRKHEDWTIPNLSLRSVEDRVAFIKSKFPLDAKRVPTTAFPDFNGDGQFDWRDFEVESEQIRVIADSDNDGKADQSRVLAAGFHSLATTVGAGVTTDGKGGIFYTCIPDLWHIAADGTKTRLLTGFGTHIVYSGHEMHGARIGPDGRLYFSIADCGARVVTKEGTIIDNPDSGAVFRCWPDGRALELFAKGLRNPQHLAFNDLGDLFTADNNADGGDKARWIHVVRGADYGWRIGWQFLPKLGAWNSEGMWHLNVAATNPAIHPPIAHIGHGPAGIAYYPGTGLPEKFRGHFFYADFPGGIRHFALKPKGATYELADFAPEAPVLQNNQATEMTGKLLWNLDPSDVQFPPGGGIMVLDWTTGWEKSGKGRIYRVFSPEADRDPLAVETKRLLGEGFANRKVKELTSLLGHADQRVRMGAQMALVNLVRGSSGEIAIAGLQETARGAGNLLGRLHAIWGLGMAAGVKPGNLDLVAELLADADQEVRAQAAKVLSEQSILPATTGVIVDRELPKVIQSGGSRAQFFSIQLAAKREWGMKEIAPLLVQNDDVMLCHSIAQALASAFLRNPPKPEDVRLPFANVEMRSVLLNALRKAKRPECAQYLEDQSPKLRLEAARAIHDEPIPEALSALISWLEKVAAFREEKTVSVAPWDGSMDAVTRRAINAAYRVGGAREAQLLASVASAPSRANLPASIRVDALDALKNWTVPLGRDRILGVVMEGDGKRVGTDAVAALGPLADKLLAHEEGRVRIAAVEAFSALRIQSVQAALFEIIQAPGDAEFRSSALRALATLGSPKLADALRFAMGAKDAQLSAEARRIGGAGRDLVAIEINAATLANGKVAERQQALANLGKSPLPEADKVLVEQLDLLVAGKLSPALHLDLLEAAAARGGEAVQSRVAIYEKTRSPQDPLSRWKETLEGGDAKLGRIIFAEKAEAGCMRCHAVKKQGGDVGPDLGGIAAHRDRTYLLRAIVEPNAEIAQGYENVLLTLNDGNVIAGMLNKENATSVTLKNPADGKPQVVKKSDIKDQQKLPSAMPPALGEVLGKRALRDLVAYLATLK